MQPSGVLHTAILAAVIALAIYLRFRRTVGRQRVTPRRLLVRVALLVLVAGTVLVALLATFSPLRLVEVLAGLGIGMGAA